MAITLKFDNGQLQSLVDAINNQTEVINAGFTDLIEALDGDRAEEVQRKINELASAVRTVKDKLQTSVDSQTKGD